MDDRRARDAANLENHDTRGSESDYWRDEKMVRSFIRLWVHAAAMTLTIYVAALTLYIVLWEVFGP